MCGPGIRDQEGGCVQHQHVDTGDRAADEQCGALPRLSRHHAPLPESAHLPQVPVLEQGVQRHCGGRLDLHGSDDVRDQQPATS